MVYETKKKNNEEDRDATKNKKMERGFVKKKFKPGGVFFSIPKGREGKRKGCQKKLQRSRESMELSRCGTCCRDSKSRKRESSHSFSCRKRPFPR